MGSMERIFKNEFIDASWDASQDFLFIKWFPTTTDMSEDQYTSTILTITEIIQDKGIRKWLGEATEYAYTISNELQEWLSQDINKAWVYAGLEKMAIIVPTDYITQISVQLSIEEIEENQVTQKFDTQYFDELQQALDWLEVSTPQVTLLNMV